ncbi:MAG: pantoate--beta-alanine ligase [Clostridiales bacterium]
MVIIDNILIMKKEVENIKKKFYSIGFVPTMGFLHDGHMSLLKKSKKDNDITILSIYVNPTQFGVNEDFNKYPRDLKRDLKMAEEEGVDIVFTPKSQEIYPKNFSTYIIEEKLSQKLCGKSRPNHFKGVATIVIKLLNILKPDNAYFGQKDYQQYLVLNKVVIDLNLDVNLISCPIIREKDGLALSSRNIHLKGKDRARALSLSKALKNSEKMINNGEKGKENILKYIEEYILNYGKCEIDYIEILNGNNLSEIDYINGKIIIAIAVKYGNTRLIDNVVLEVK